MAKNVGFLARIRYNYLKVHKKLSSQNMVNNSQIVLLLLQDQMVQESLLFTRILKIPFLNIGIFLLLIQM